jgi:heat shock protein HslJ
VGKTLTSKKDMQSIIAILFLIFSTGLTAGATEISAQQKFSVIEMRDTAAHMVSGPANSFFSIDTAKNRIAGKGGCNNFFGSAAFNFTSPEKGSLKIERMGSTMMACPNLYEEQMLFKNLEAADNFELINDELFIKKGEAVLIKAKIL